MKEIEPIVIDGETVKVMVGRVPTKGHEPHIVKIVVEHDGKKRETTIDIDHSSEHTDESFKRDVEQTALNLANQLIRHNANGKVLDRYFSEIET